MTTIGRYEVFDLLGAGGMATVHLGRLAAADRLASVVALKRLHAGLAHDPAYVAMLLDEARLAARVRHPNAAAMLEVFEEAGEVVLVMEYVEGETLARLHGAWKPSIAAAIACDVLEALHAAHEARDATGKPLGLVHRDVSPQNILVGTDGLAHLLDFGIAKAAGRQQVTRDGSIKGKVGYLAPESLRGRPATRSADIYATAAVLWEMLAGTRLFDGETEAAAVVAALGGAREPPSARAPAVPAALDAVVMRGLAPLPHARFPTARAMAEAVRVASDIAAPAEVAAWLETAAPEALQARRAAVRAMTARAAPPARKPEKPSMSRGRARAATIGAMAITVAVSVAWMIHASVAREQAGGTPLGGGTASSSTAPEAGSSAEALGEEAADASKSSEPAAPAAASVGRSAPGRPPRVRVAAPAVAASPPRRDCEPPYTLEGHRKVFKPGCL